MKKILTALLFMLLSVPSFAEIASGTCGDNLTWSLSDDYTLTIDGEGDMYDWDSSLIVPWNSYKERILKLSIGKKVTSIGSYSFKGCSALTSVTIPNSVISIRYGAFVGCTSLPTENGLRYADTYLVGVAGEAQSSYIIKEGTRFVGCDAFSGCSALTSVIIPNSVISIGSKAFIGCSSLTSVTIPNSVTNIGDEVFYNCSSLISVTIPNSVKNIGTYAFRNCNSLPAENGLRYAGTYLVGVAGEAQSSYTIKEGTRFVGCDAFYGCSALTSVIIPNSVISIGYDAFAYCSGLTSVNIPNSVTNIEYNAFVGCTSLPTENGLRYADTYLVGVAGEAQSSYTIKEGTRFVGCDAFRDCSALTSVIIPNSVISIEDGAFLSSGLTSVTIGNSVTHLENHAFQFCKKLTSITLPNSVTSIGVNAFGVCSSLTSVTIPNSVTSIDACAFSGCSALTSVTIPSSVTSIGNCVFQDCSALTSVTIPNSVKRIGYRAFYYCENLTSVTIPNSVTNIGDEAFSNCSSLISVTIGNSVTHIGEYAFGSCRDLKNLYILGSTSLEKVFGYTGNFEVLFISKGVPENILRTILSYSTKKLYVEWEHPYTYQSSWGIIPRQAVLYVPKGTVDNYRAESGWRDFSEIIEYDVEKFKRNLVGEEGTDDEVTLTLYDGSNGSIVAMLEANKAYTFGFSADNGWKVSSVTFNDEDVTSSLANNFFTTPALTGNSTLSVVYTLDTATDAKSIEHSNARVLNVAGGIDVSNVALGQTIGVFTTDGKRLASAVSNGQPQHIDINESGVVIIKIGNDTFKTYLR